VALDEIDIAGAVRILAVDRVDGSGSATCALRDGEDAVLAQEPRGAARAADAEPLGRELTAGDVGGGVRVAGGSLPTQRGGQSDDVASVEGDVADLARHRRDGTATAATRDVDVSVLVW